MNEMEIANVPLFTCSEQMDLLSPAMVGLQSKVKNPPYNASVETKKFTYDYVTLDAILDLLRPLLTEYKLAVMHSCTLAKGNIVIATRVMHESGQWLDVTMEFATGTWSAQGVGGALTYARRYALAALFAFCCGYDDDANYVSNQEDAKTKSKPVTDGRDAAPPDAAGIEYIRRKVEKCETLRELSDYYNKISPVERTTCQRYFSERREELERGTR